MLPAFEALRREPREPVIEMLEHTPPAELVAGRDILRRDQLGRTVVAVPRERFRRIGSC